MLQRALGQIEPCLDPAVLVGFDTADDAGVYRIGDDVALVQSVDFFTPIVDDPFVFGQIAAANALSDIYAMGGTPRFALSILGFPSSFVEEDVLVEVLQGGSSKMREAGAPVIGGHSVRDRELKFGYCVTGLVHPQRVFRNAGCRPGDVLILTKPIGTGIVGSAIRLGRASPEVVQEAVRSMLELNGPVHKELAKADVTAVTDITGFGLLGHALEMAKASGVTLALDAASIPALGGVVELLRAGVVPRAIEDNRRFVESCISWPGVSSMQKSLFLDPQTSGGLLVSVSPERAPGLRADLEKAGHFTWMVGTVHERTEVPLQVH